MRLNSNCYIILDVKSKISWYSSDIGVGYKMWYDKKDGNGCEQNVTEPFVNYADGTIINIGSKYKVDGKGDPCLVKYDLKNENDLHDMRI